MLEIFEISYHLVLLVVSEVVELYALAVPALCTILICPPAMLDNSAKAD